MTMDYVVASEMVRQRQEAVALAVRRSRGCRKSSQQLGEAAPIGRFIAHQDWAAEPPKASAIATFDKIVGRFRRKSEASTVNGT